ncbi:hypothetical protein ACISMT_06945, partial [Campylobacter jejuni]
SSSKLMRLPNWKPKISLKEELNNFLKEYLSFLKYEKNEEILQQSFRNLNGIFSNKNFTAYDLGFSTQDNDEPF